MIEVRKYIPQVYNQSRDFSVFMGVIQTLLNELDIKSKVLESIPDESILPPKLSSFPQVKSDFRSMLKRKGSIMCILYAITLSGGLPPSFEEESLMLSDPIEKGGLNYSGELVNRILDSEGRLKIIDDSGKEIFLDKNTPTDESPVGTGWLNKLVYYTEKVGSGLKLHINIKDLSKINQSLLGELWYYLKPVNTMVILEQFTGDISQVYSF